MIGNVEEILFLNVDQVEADMSLYVCRRWLSTYFSMRCGIGGKSAFELINEFIKNGLYFRRQEARKIQILAYRSFRCILQLYVYLLYVHLC